MKFKTATDLNYITPEELDKLEKLLVDFAYKICKEFKLPSVVLAESALKLLEFDMKTVSPENKMGYQRDMIMSVFNLFEIDPLQFAIQFADEIKEMKTRWENENES